MWDSGSFETGSFHPESFLFDMQVEVQLQGGPRVRVRGSMLARSERDIIDLTQLAMLAYQRVINESQ